MISGFAVSLTADGTADMTNSLKTSGGDTVILRGVNFGPIVPRSFVTSVMLGGYAVSGCNMTEVHVELTCATQPGVGMGLRWTVRLMLRLFCITPKNSPHCMVYMSRYLYYLKQLNLPPCSHIFPLPSRAVSQHPCQSEACCSLCSAQTLAMKLLQLCS